MIKTYWVNIALTVLAHDNSEESRGRIASRIIESVDSFTASELLDWLYF